jgi:hypothetical protein
VGCKKIGHRYMHAGLLQAACTSVFPKDYNQEKVRESWYGKLDSLLAQTLQKKIGKEKTENLIFKLPKNSNKSRNPKEYSPQYGCQFCCWEKYPTD